MNLSTKSVCVVDNGIFSELATTLAKSFGKVYYTAPWLSSFPSSHQIEIGEGFRDFERINDIWDIVNDVDLFVFPDLFHGPLQEYLVDQGKRVFGARNGDELENYRNEAKEHFKEIGIPQGPYEVVEGITKLRQYIKSKGDDQKLWVKINLTRKDTETFPTEGYPGVKNRLDALEADLGPAAEVAHFVVEENLADSLDIAIDTYSIDGKYPVTSLLGTEEKGEAYICAVKQWDQIPGRITSIYEKLSPDLAKFQYRNFLSLESRCKGNSIWLADPCCRFGSPPAELQLNLLTNMAEIMWQGAEGKLVEPVYGAKYGVELVVHSDWADSHPTLIEFPAKYRDQIKFRYAAQFDKEIWIMPQGGGPRVAAIVSQGDDPDKCFDEVRDISKTIKGAKIETFTRSIDALQGTMKQLASWGIKF